MQKKTKLALACAMAGCLLSGCNDDDKDPISQGLKVDSNPNSCQSLTEQGQQVIVGSDQHGDPAAPEPASGYRLGLKAKVADQYMVVANTPLASKAGCEVLRAGGSAIDAAIAVQAVLGLVEPQSSTLAGSTFMLYFDAKTQQVTAYDGRETAPAAATAYYLTRQDQADQASASPVPNTRRSGRSIGVPGTMRMFELAHQEHGKLPWSSLYQDAIHLSTQGFRIPGRLASAIASNAANLALDANAMHTFFYPDGQPRGVGEWMTNPEYAKTLEALAAQGADALHTGPIAARIVAKAGQSVGDDANQTPITPSLMTLQDLANYKALKRTAICTQYREYTVCGMPPPSSGGIAVAQTLGILSHFDLPAYPPLMVENEGGIPQAQAVHWIAEAERLAYADRDRYVADTDFVPLPAQGIHSLLDPAYLKARSALIQADQSMGVAAAGEFGVSAGTAETPEHGTTQFTIVDAYGNVASVTSTVEASMGSFHMTDGFLLSNQLTDFSAQAFDSEGHLIANRVEGNKRPRSSMAPTLVFKGHDSKDFYMATGSPGGATIIQYVVKNIVAGIDWQLNPQQAASLLNFGASNSRSTGIDGSNPQLDLSRLVQALEAKGHLVNRNAQSSGVSSIMQQYIEGKIRYVGGVDPRREGLVLGHGAL